MIAVGITGMAGCGKSTLAALFAADGAAVTDLDAVGHSFYSDASCEVYRELVVAFGGEVAGLVSADGTIDRKALGARVFTDPQALSRLNAIFFQRFRGFVAADIERARVAGAEIYVLDAAVLFESGLDPLMDHTVWVEAAPEAAVERLRAGRAMREEYARDLVSRQAEKYSGYRSKAGFVVDNSGGRDALRKEYDRIKKEIRSKCQA